eukprot:2354877-Rhodomonas_salina.1
MTPEPRALKPNRRAASPDSSARLRPSSSHPCLERGPPSCGIEREREQGREGEREGEKERWEREGEGERRERERWGETDSSRVTSAPHVPGSGEGGRTRERET